MNACDRRSEELDIDTLPLQDLEAGRARAEDELPTGGVETSPIAQALQQEKHQAEFAHAGRGYVLLIPALCSS